MHTAANEQTAGGLNRHFSKGEAQGKDNGEVLATRERQLKSTMRHHHTADRTTERTQNAGEAAGRRDPGQAAGGKVKRHSPSEHRAEQATTIVRIKTWTRMFTAA